MKVYQKAIMLVVVLVLVLAAFGLIAGAPVTHSPTASQSISMPAQVIGVPAVNQPQMATLMRPNVSWNS